MVNILDSEKIDLPELELQGDKLDQIFQAQRILMNGYKPILESHLQKIHKVPIKIDDNAWNGGEHNLHTKEGTFLIKDMIDAAIHELSEAVQTIKVWKTWKQTDVPTDVNHFKEEMVDSIHFVVEALLLAGVTPEEVFRMYMKKNKVNRFRQKSNY